MDVKVSEVQSFPQQPKEFFADEIPICLGISGMFVACLRKIPNKLRRETPHINME
jgi:hypothetical protein